MLACGALAQTARAQTAVELRVGSTRYRFSDVSHGFKSGLLLDLLYTGMPGMDELYAGAGYQWKPGADLTLTPVAYAVFGKQNGERGATLGALISRSKGRFRLAGFAGHFFRFSGRVPDYDFIDPLEATLAVGDYELGGSLGLFRQSGASSWLAGPVVKRNDSRGSWALAVRTGDDHELRIVRVIAF